MPRQARIDSPGTLHHIIARGIDRRTIFDDDEDRFDFLKNLGSILEEAETACYAWALIPNHIHLLLRTGPVVPIASVMGRLLTGHAVRYNRRHQRHGHLFQNRYKSILCQEDSYLLELVRYIHLNPLWAGLVADMNELDHYPFAGHAVIMGNCRQPWQDREKIIRLFGKRTSASRRKYREFIVQGINEKRRDDLTGGGLLRSAGGWEAVKELQRSEIHMKSDKRILGDADFISDILSRAGEFLKRRYALRANGIDIDFIAGRVANLLAIPEDVIWQKGKSQHLVRARSLLCFWAVRELGESMTSLARRLNISTVAVSKSVTRGAEIAKKEGLKLVES
ncbi:MAG: transposase [Thermodesulfobacteriota bacterium]